MDNDNACKFLKQQKNHSLIRQAGSHIVFTLHRAVALLPWPVARALGRLCGRLAYRFVPSRRRVAATNIALCLPELDGNSQHDLVRAHFDALGIGLMELGLAWYGSDQKLASRVDVIGRQRLLEAGAGRGVILLCGHFTTLDLCNRLLGGVIEHAAVWRPLGQAAADYWTARGRRRGATALFEKSAFRGAIRWLRDGGTLLMAADQADRSDGAIMAPFFEHPASTNVTVWRLARSTGCAVLPVVTGRRADGHYQLEFDAPLAGVATQSAAAAAAALNTAIEAQVRRYPEQYYWVHRRFKETTMAGSVA